MTLYQRLCLWVQEMQAGNLASGKLLYVLGALPMAFVPVIGSWWLIPALSFGAVWWSFITWRLWKMAQTGLVEADLLAKRNTKNG